MGKIFLNLVKTKPAMKTIILIITAFFFLTFASAQTNFEKDVFETSSGDLTITFLGHGTLYFELDSYVIHIDPVGRYADYSKLPKADLILVTHHHGDHLDSAVIETLWKDDTEMVLTQICHDKMQKGVVMNNGDEQRAG